eukprot:366009-Chlamydomonas_euryale.AAC.17
MPCVPVVPHMRVEMICTLICIRKCIDKGVDSLMPLVCSPCRHPVLSARLASSSARSVQRRHITCIFIVVAPTRATALLSISGARR